MRGDEDREHRGRHPRRALHQGGRARAHAGPEVGLEAVAVQEVGLPAVVVGDLDLVLGDVLEVRQRVAVLEDAVELLADHVPVALDPCDPEEQLGIEEGRVAYERAPPDEALDRRQDLFAPGDGATGRSSPRASCGPRGRSYERGPAGARLAQAHLRAGGLREAQAASRSAASSGDSASFFSARCSSWEARSAEKPRRLPIAVSVWGSSWPVPKRSVSTVRSVSGSWEIDLVDDPLALVLPDGLLGSLELGREQVPEGGVAVLADLLVEADEGGPLVANLLDLLDLETGLGRQLLERGLAPEPHGQLALDAADLARALGHVDGQPDRAARVLEAALDRLADPEGRVGGEAEALAPVELLARADQSEHALLDEVRERQALVLVAAGVRRDEAQVGVDEQFLGVQVSALDPLGEFDLLGGRQQRVATRVGEQLIDGLRDEALGGLLRRAAARVAGDRAARPDRAGPPEPSRRRSRRLPRRGPGGGR